MKYLATILFLLLFIPFQALAVNVTWDYSNNILKPLQSLWTKEVQVPYITATSTATSTLPYLSVTGALNLFGTVGSTLSDFCVAITGGAGLCDGTDETGAGTVSFGSDNQIPYTNGTTDDFDYSALFTFDGDTLTAPTTTLSVPLGASSGGLGADFSGAGNGVMTWFDTIDQSLIADAWSDLATLLTGTLDEAEIDADIARDSELPTGANPSATIGLSAVNGSASTFLRSDGSPALSQAIVPTWTGEHTFTATTSLATTTITGALEFLPDGIDYLFTTCGINCVILQNQTAGQASQFRLMSKDGDGTDPTFISVHAVGTPADVTNQERIRLGWDGSSSFGLATAKSGSGTQRPLFISADGGTDQIILNTDGTLKLGNLTSNGFLKTSGGDGTLTVDTSTYLTGNETITLSGDVTGSGETAITTAIGSGVIVNDDINGSAAIAYSKLNLAGSISETDLNANAPTDDYVLTASSTASGGFAWSPSSGSSEWTDGGNYLYSTEDTDRVLVGTSTDDTGGQFIIATSTNHILLKDSDGSASRAIALTADNSRFEIKNEPNNVVFASYGCDDCATDDSYVSYLSGSGSATIQSGGATNAGMQFFTNGTGDWIFNTDVDSFVGIGDTSPTQLLDLAGSNSLGFAGTAILSDSAGTLTLSNVDAIDATTEATFESAIDSLSNLTTVGTITSGTWSATDIAVTAGGTGASDASTARTNLGLAIGSDVQAYDADLDTYAGITPSANVQSILSAANYSAIVALLESAIESALDTLTNLTTVAVSTVLEIPNGTNPTVDAGGELALDTTDNQLVIGTSTTAAIIPTTFDLYGFQIASTSAKFASSTTIYLPAKRDGFTVTEFRCHVTSGTSKVVIAFGESHTCTLAGLTDTSIVSPTVTAGATSTPITMGTESGSVDDVNITISGVYTRE